MANTLLTPSIIAKEGLMQLENNLAMGRNVHKAYKNEFVKVGDSVTIRKPNKFRATKSASRSNSTITEPSTSITITTQAHVSWKFSSQELTLTIEDYSKRYIGPAVLALANTVDEDLCGLYTDIYNSVGTPGTTPGTFSVLGAAQQKLDEEAVPDDRRVAIVNPAAHWALADGLKGTFAAKVAEDIITKGYLGTIANLSIYMDQNIQRHLTGKFTTGATPLVNATSTSKDVTLATKDWNTTNNTVKKGDVFTIANVNAINPVSGKSVGVLRQFAVRADTTSANPVSIPVTPTIQYTSTDPYSTVSALPLEDAALTFFGSEETEYPQNLVFHPNAFGLVTVPLEMPANVWGARESDSDMGLSIRIVKQYEVGEDEEIIRLDILYGVKTLYPELAVRLWG